MRKLKLSNTNLIIGGLLITTFCLSFLLLVSFITKGYIHNYAIAQLGVTGDFFNGIVSPFISIVSAILIYITFKQQVDVNQDQTDRFNKEQLNSKADKDFDRYLKLIDEVERYRQRIQIVKTNSMSAETTTYNGNDAIVAYIAYVKTPDNFRRFQTINNRVEFEKTFYTYLVYLNFIFSNVNSLKQDYYSYYTFLITKLFMNVPNTIYQINELIDYESVITNGNRNNEALVLWQEIFKAKTHIDFITYN